MQNLAKQSYNSLADIFLTASVPRAVDYYGFNEAWHAIYRSIRYYYFDQVDQGDKPAMLQQMLQVRIEPNLFIEIENQRFFFTRQFYGDSYYKAPHDYFVNALVRNNIPTYIYRYAYATTDPLNNGTGS